MRSRCAMPDQEAHARAPHSSGKRAMKASRLTAIGLVAAAGLWIASGHLMPHQGGESRVAVRDGAAKKPFRVAVATTSVVPHSRKLTIAGRTEADKRVTVTARTGGGLTHLKIKRGMGGEKGDVIARLSPQTPRCPAAQTPARGDA